MEEQSTICYPVGGFEDIKEFDLKEFGDIENADYNIAPERATDIANLACFRLENARQFTEKTEYDVAVEVTKSALWLLEILNKRIPYKQQ